MEKENWWYKNRRTVISIFLSGNSFDKILDYGCGTGVTTQSLKRFGTVFGTDKSQFAMEKTKSNKIETIKFDLVNSTDSTELFETFDLITLFDVLEHIPEKEIPQTLTDIFDRAKKFVFLGIDTSPAQTVLSNGENAHCTLKSLKWWINMVNEHEKKVYTHVMTNGQDSGYEILNDELYFDML